ncbi:hypothetical protein pb186bvf_003332 [Paramecium bursaria]
MFLLIKLKMNSNQMNDLQNQQDQSIFTLDQSLSSEQQQNASIYQKSTSVKQDCKNLNTSLSQSAQYKDELRGAIQMNGYGRFNTLQSPKSMINSAPTTKQIFQSAYS